MGTVIAVTSGKGGTGKTTVTAGISSALALMGKDVLCIDMDVGLRNLDIPLGLSDRVLMTFVDVAEGRCPMEKAAVSRPDLAHLFLLTAPPDTREEISPEKTAALVRQARDRYDYVVIDSAAGIGPYFRLACDSADRVLVVSAMDASTLRDAQHTVSLLSQETIHLIINRVQTKMLRELQTNIDFAMDTAGLPLLGVIPEDPAVLLSANTGTPLLLYGNSRAARACRNIAGRITGQHIPLMRFR